NKTPTIYPHSQPQCRANPPAYSPSSPASTGHPPTSPHKPPPPPRNQNPALTSEPDADILARTHAQGQSDFFAKLPLELRRMVYEYVVGAETVHLTLGAKRRFGHFICEDRVRMRGGGGGDGVDEEEGEDRGNINKNRHSNTECSCRVLVGGRKSSAKLNSAALGMLTVCRRMYTETTPHLYTPHTFSLLHITHLLYLPTRIPPQRLSSIHTLHLRWAIRALPHLRRGPASRLAYREDTANWERGWNIIAALQGLRCLRVVLADPSPGQVWERGWLALEDVLLEPVKRVCAPECAVVVLPYRRCRVDWDLGASRVVLRRPGEEGEGV
ncbi:hypothetical protein J1614_008634, partial [Plenodomus biglobosus]